MSHRGTNSCYMTAEHSSPDANYEGLAYLESLPQWDGTSKFDLSNLELVLAGLGQPQEATRTVHVTGTNGKGSVSATIAAILGASGARVGLYTSPHLSKLNERILIDGRQILDAELDAACIQVRAAIPAAIKLTYFEALTAAAFLAFSRAKLDWVVLEVGLGGRLDGTNVIKHPAAAVIVSIDYDHEHILGNTLEAIASEKAGIIKEKCLLVTGDIADGPMSVIAEAARCSGARHLQASRDFSGRATPEGLRINSNNISEIRCVSALRGPHQAGNMAIAATVCAELGISSEHIVYGIEHVFWPGRLERLRVGKREVLVDCAHNPAGVRSLVTYLAGNSYHNLEMVFGVLDTKSWQQMVEMLYPHVGSWNLLRPDSVRALNHSILQSYMSGFDIKSRDYEDDYQALVVDRFAGARSCEFSDSTAAPDTLVTGSIYMVGKLRALLGVPERAVWQRSEAMA